MRHTFGSIGLLIARVACSKPNPAGTGDTSAPATTTATARPTAPEVAIAPDAPDDNQDLHWQITTDATDADDDPLSYTFAWTVDDEPFTGAATTTVHDGDTVTAAETTIGETWTCIVTASDPVGAGPPDEDSVQIVPYDCLAGHWPFDEGGGGVAGDASGRGNDGTLAGDATWAVGRVGGALSLDGDDDYVSMGDALNGLQLPAALSAWVWMDGADYFRIVNTDDDDVLYSGLWLAVDPNDRFSASFGDGTGGGGYQWRRTATSDDPVPRRTWVHLAAIFHGGADIELFVDGLPVAVTFDGAGGPPSTTDFPFHVGRTLDSPTESLGAIDELRVYDCDPGAAAIAATANP